MKLIKKRRKFLDETVKYYSKNPIKRRSINKNGECDYFPTKLTSQGCAIGRHLSPKLSRKLDEMKDAFVRKDEVFELLPKKLRKLGQSFLSDVQRLHDVQQYWTKNGLSHLGERKLESIKESFNLK